jgi:hypothetical protein
MAFLIPFLRSEVCEVASLIALGQFLFLAAGCFKRMVKLLPKFPVKLHLSPPYLSINPLKQIPFG